MEDKILKLPGGFISINSLVAKLSRISCWTIEEYDHSYCNLKLQVTIGGINPVTMETLLELHDQEWIKNFNYELTGLISLDGI